MKSRLEELEEWGTEVIFGRARGFRAGLMRMLLRGLSWGFKGMVKARLKLFKSKIKKDAQLGTLVISIGNITVGGTGKTPVTELLAKTLQQRGRKVAILSRGYKSHDLEQPQEWHDARGVLIKNPPKIVSDGKNLLLGPLYAGDEPYMLAKNLRDICVVVDRDRVKAARFAIAELGCDTLLLDDGMQYLKLAHELDLVLVDSTSPFGTGALLPRGTLREPAGSLKRASYIVLTKCGNNPQQALISDIRRYNRTAEIIESDHVACYLENVFSGERQPLEFLKDKWVACISGIARPESFENSLKKLGAKVDISKHFTDHHWFEQQEIDQFMQRCADRAMDLIVTTEKDAVRFPEPSELDVPVYFLRIEVQILSGHNAWKLLVDRICDNARYKPRHQW